MNFLPQTFAHTIEEDETVQALIHISPEDTPIAGERAVIYLGIQSNEKNIDVSLCDCMVRIEKNNQVISHQKLLVNNGEDKPLYNAYLPFTFPQEGKYSIKVLGNTAEVNSGEQFQLNFTTKVEKEVASNQNSIVPIAILAVIVLIIGISITLLLMRKRVKISS